MRLSKLYFGMEFATPEVPTSTIAPIGVSKPIRRYLFLTAIALVILAGSAAFLLHLHSAAQWKSSALKGGVAMTAAQLEGLVRSESMTVYWGGPRVGYLYTLDTTVKNRTILSYISKNKQASNVVGNSRLIATYYSKDAFNNSVAAANLQTNTGFRNPDGSVVFYATNRKTDVYLAYPKDKYQIEIFDPIVGQALSLAILQGQITKVGA